jgi:predicted GTPase
VRDPPEEREAPTVELDALVAWRVAYAKVFRFVGMDRVARQIERGARAESLRSIDSNGDGDSRERDREFDRRRRVDMARERFRMDLVLDAGSCAVAVAPEVLRVLQHGIDRESLPALDEATRYRRETRHRIVEGSSFETELGIGCLFDDDW